MIIIEFRILFSLKPFYSSSDTWFQYEIILQKQYYCLLLTPTYSDRHSAKVVPKSFYLNGNTVGFPSQIKKLESETKILLTIQP